MTMTDGWVGEQVSLDHTVVPVLYAPKPSPTSRTAASAPLSKDRARERRRPRPIATFMSSLVRLAMWTPLLAGLTLVSMLVWPHLEDLFVAHDEHPVTVALIDEPSQRFLVEGDSMYLEGSVPNQAVSDAFEEAAVELLGEGRVINNFRIDIDAVFDPSLPVSLSVAETVQFASGGTEIGERYRPLIGLATEMLAARPALRLTIIGHTDATGDDAANIDLSLRRAQATAHEFEAGGVDPRRLSIEGHGESEPVATNDTEPGRQQNRRVEFLVTGLLN